MEDFLKGAYRFAKSLNPYKETNLERLSSNLQEMLDEHNTSYGDSNWSELGGIPFERKGLNPFTPEEIDVMRHYYGQKLALETENPIEALLVPFGHEAFNFQTGIMSPHSRESMHDLYVNKKAIGDYYQEKGLPGKGIYNMLLSGDTTKEQFEDFGDRVLENIPAIYPDE